MGLKTKVKVIHEMFYWGGGRGTFRTEICKLPLSPKCQFGGKKGGMLLMGLKSKVKSYPREVLCGKRGVLLELKSVNFPYPPPV